MQSFKGKLAVVTGGGTGMGRELVRKLCVAGADVAMCDVSAENMAETEALCAKDNPRKVQVSSHLCDVADRASMEAFRDATLAAHQRDHVNLLFNNAGIGGGGSFINDSEEEWQRCFTVCWDGVYNGARAFMPLLVASSEGHIINTSSVNGFWASLGNGVAHTSYSAAKFAVKGFTEALINDCRLNAPHVGVSLVMPGHIGTSIALNSGTILGRGTAMDLSAEDVQAAREMMLERGLPVGNVPDDHIRAALHQRAVDFRDKAPTSAGQAADIILNGVLENRWRILVGEDAHELDRLVRTDPEQAYEKSLVEKMHAAGHFGELVNTVGNNDEANA